MSSNNLEHIANIYAGQGIAQTPSPVLLSWARIADNPYINAYYEAVKICGSSHNIKQGGVDHAGYINVIGWIP